LHVMSYYKSGQHQVRSEIDQFNRRIMHLLAKKNCWYYRGKQRLYCI